MSLQMPEAIWEARKALIEAAVAAMYAGDISRAARLQEMAQETYFLTPAEHRETLEAARLAKARA